MFLMLIGAPRSLEYKLQTLVCVPNQQPKDYHPTRAARAGTPVLDSELPGKSLTSAALYNIDPCSLR